MPVTATNSGGVTEVVVPGETGYLCEVGDIETMADYSRKILTDPELAASLGRAGRRVALKKFSLDHIVGLYEDLYEEVRARRQEFMTQKHNPEL